MMQTMTLTVDTAEKILRERYNFFTNAINTGNIEAAVTEYYAPDAYATGHETPLMKGFEAMIGMFTDIAQEFKNMKIHLIDTRVAGDDCIYSLATATSTLSATGEDAAIKSLLVFRKQSDGKWLCDADIFAMGGFE